MKRKQLICYAFTTGVSAVNVLSCNPFLPGVVAMIGSESISKPLLLAFVFGGCACFMPYVMAIKYLTISLLILIGEKLIKHYYGYVGTIASAALSSGCVFLVGLAGDAFKLNRYGVMVISLEAAFTFGMVLTFKRLIHRLLLEKRKLIKVSELPEQEKSEHLYRYAKALRKMAKSYGGRQVAAMGGAQVELAEGEKTIQKGLCAIAAAIEGCNAKPVYECLDMEEEIRQMEYMLKEKGIDTWQYSVYIDEEGRHSLQFEAKAQMHQGITLRRMAKMASGVFGYQFAPRQQAGGFVGKTKQTIMLKEVGRFQVRFHVEKACKEGAKVCGDNFSFLRQEEGKTLITLSDGMGYGQIACRQSETVLELVEELIGAGFSPKDALPMVNGCLSNPSTEGFMATVDLCEIDEFTGATTFYKMGAPVSFLMKKNQVETIESAALPAGAFQDAQIIPVRKKLYHGDYVVMVSDGILDSLGKENPEETLRQVLRMLPRGNPGAMASQIMKIAKEAGGKLSDDCMVIVAGVWER